MPAHDSGPNPPSRALQLRGRGHSPAAGAVARWCANVARLMHMARRHGIDGQDACALRAQLGAELVALVADHGALELDVTPRALVLGEEPVFEADNANAQTGEHALQHELSWILHRDGVRTLHLTAGVNEREADGLLMTLLAAAPASATHEDLVTLLWEAGLEHVRLRTEEWSPVRENPLMVRQDARAVPHVDDRPVLEAGLCDVKRLWAELAAGEAAGLSAFQTAWAAERTIPFRHAAQAFVTRILTRDPRPEMSQALAAAVVTWIATSVQRSDWQEALSAHALLNLVDPSGEASADALTPAFQSVDIAAISERLDEADVREQSRLFAFAVRVGAPALPLLAGALGLCSKARVRAGITTALAYAFADDPAPLGKLLGDARWHVVRNLVFVLGHIGGAAVVPHLAVAARHVDMRVRRAAIHALGQVPQELRRDVLLSQLDHSDGRLVASALAMLAREPDAKVSSALVARVQAAAFTHRPEEQKIALLFALADVGGSKAIPTLEELLLQGGWFARRTPERSAAARALARAGTGEARKVLERGQRHRNDAVREACDEALTQRGSA